MRRILIMGAAGKDFHVFNSCYRQDPQSRVVAFTATQIPNIDHRQYPAELAGPQYPQGIPIHPERELEKLVRQLGVDEVVFAYSDVSYRYLDERRAVVGKAGARFRLPDPDSTMLLSSRPVVAVSAVRTGCGKSQTTRRVVQLLRDKGRRVVVLRHPMPYGNLLAQEVQRFERLEDFERYGCTIEEMEEFEPHLRRGVTVFAGVDYGKILEQAEKDVEIVVWDGGNNDTPFLRPDLWIVVADPHRSGHELTHYPGSINFRRAGVIVINKVDSAPYEGVEQILTNARKVNPRAAVIQANSLITVDRPDLVQGKGVLVIEDGPTVTHGDMAFGAGVLAAQRYGARELVDPRPYAIGSLAEIFRQYPHLRTVLPAMGYGRQQMKELEETINRSPCETVLVGTPFDLSRALRIQKPCVRVTYELEEISRPGLAELLKDY